MRRIAVMGAAGRMGKTLVEAVQQLDRHAAARRKPARMFAHRGRVDRAVHQGDDLVVHVPSPPLMRRQLVQGAGLVMDGKPVDQRLRGGVHTDQLHLRAVAPEL